ncbi:MAG TPA: nuclear transport factor 2 family protein [Thermoanaerobaculia bacterium]|nr:nuclear transport factor 2 family protein [Thermoanaerobaculia bacterium]
MRDSSKIVFPLLLAIGLAGACSPASDNEETTSADTGSAGTAAAESTPAPELDPGVVGQVRDRYIAAVNDGDLDALMGFWSEDGVLIPPGQPAASGREAIRAWYQNMFNQVDADIDIRSAETRIAGDWGYDRGTFTMTLAPKTAAGGTGTAAPGTPPGPAAADVKTPPSPQTFNYVVILQRGGGGDWKVARNIWSPDASPAAPGAPDAGRQTTP